MNAILSIKPEFVEKIFDGTKQYEFRKILFTKKIKKIIIYATRPIGKIVGEFEVGTIIEDHPNIVWSKTNKLSGISKCFFDQYYTGRDKAVAIEVKNVEKYKTPLPYQKLIPGGTPPQSFVYFDRE
jgi:predicted transcriptional regulator